MIGSDCLFAPEVYISSGSHVFDRLPGVSIRKQDQLFAVSNAVAISDNCWLGIRTFVAPGVYLAEGTVTGANSVMTKNTEKFSVYAGVPAKKLRTYE